MTATVTETLALPAHRVDFKKLRWTEDRPPKIGVASALLQALPAWTATRAWRWFEAWRQQQGLPETSRGIAPCGGPDGPADQRLVYLTSLPVVLDAILSLPFAPEEQLRGIAAEMVTHFGLEVPAAQPSEMRLRAGAGSVTDCMHPDIVAATAATHEEASALEGLARTFWDPSGACEVKALVDSRGLVWFKADDIARCLDNQRPTTARKAFVQERCQKTFKELVSDTRPEIAGCVPKKVAEDTWINEQGLWQWSAAEYRERVCRWGDKQNAMTDWWHAVIEEMCGTFRRRRIDAASGCIADEASAAATNKAKEALQLQLMEMKADGLRLEAEKLQLEIAEMRDKRQRAETNEQALALAPCDWLADGTFTAWEFLRRQGLAPDQIRGVQTAFGRMLKQVYIEHRGRQPPTRTQWSEWGAVDICTYSVREDMVLCDLAWAALKQSDAWKTHVVQRLRPQRQADNCNA